jgi:hypothetical protein
MRWGMARTFAGGGGGWRLWGQRVGAGQRSAHKTELVKVRLKSDYSIHRKRLESTHVRGTGCRLMDISFTDSIRCQTGGKGHASTTPRPPYDSVSEH